MQAESKRMQSENYTSKQCKESNSDIAKSHDYEYSRKRQKQNSTSQSIGKEEHKVNQERFEKQVLNLENVNQEEVIIQNNNTLIKLSRENKTLQLLLAVDSNEYDLSDPLINAKLKFNDVKVGNVRIKLHNVTIGSIEFILINRDSINIDFIEECDGYSDDLYNVLINCFEEEGELNSKFESVLSSEDYEIANTGACIILSLSLSEQGSGQSPKVILIISLE